MGIYDVSGQLSCPKIRVAINADPWAFVKVTCNNAGAVVVVQLAEQLLHIPLDPGLNTTIRIF